MQFGPETGETKSFTKLRESFASEAQELANEAQGIEQDRQIVKAADAADPKAMKLAGTIKSRELALLQKKLAFGRRVLSEYIPTRNGVRHEAQQVAHLAHEEARTKVIEAMVAAGFRDGLDTRIGVVGILPDQVMRHPAVQASAGKLKSAKNAAWNKDDLLATRTEVAALEEILKATAAKLAA